MTTSKIPSRMIPFFGLAGLVILGLLLGGCGQKNPPNSSNGDTQQVSSSQEISDYQTNTIVMTPSEASRYGAVEYDSSGSKVSFPPPSYRTAAQTTYGSSPDPFEYTTSASAGESGGSSVQYGTYGTSTVAYTYRTSSTYSGVDQVFHGAHAQGSDPVFHGAHPSGVDPVFHGAHY